MKRRRLLAHIILGTVAWGLLLAVIQRVTGIGTWALNLASVIIIIMVYGESD